MTRYELAIVSCRMGELVSRNTGTQPPRPPITDVRFTDLPPDHWATRSVQRLVEAGVFPWSPPFVDFPSDTSGFKQGFLKLVDEGAIPPEEHLHGNRPALRREAMEWLARCLGYAFQRESGNDEEAWTFRNANDKEFALTDVLAGYPGGDFRLDQPITRYEFVVMLQKLINCFYPEMMCPK